MMRLRAEQSDAVTSACSFCGGGEGGFVRRSGPGGHAAWCATHNSETRPQFIHHPTIATPERVEQQEKIAERKTFAADLYDDGYSVGQIAEILGVSSWTVRADLAAMGRM